MHVKTPTSGELIALGTKVGGPDELINIKSVYFSKIQLNDKVILYLLTWNFKC